MCRFILARSVGLRHYLWVLYEPDHHQLPAELFAGVCQVRERWPHQCGPEDNGEVSGGHLVGVLVFSNLW